MIAMKNWFGINTGPKTQPNETPNPDTYVNSGETTEDLYCDYEGNPFKDVNTSKDSNYLNYDSAEKVMKFNAEEAEKNRAWQKMMSDTSYQRAVADLKSAGINPLMAVSGLSGASSGSGSSASTSNQTYDNDQTIISALIRGLSQVLSTTINSAVKLIK